MEPRHRRPFTNGVKPIHAVLLVVFLLVRYTYGGIDLRARRSANEELHDLAINAPKISNNHGPELHANGDLHADEEHGDGHGHGYQVFHVEFERVELPFIIALWIFVSSLAKIGNNVLEKSSVYDLIGSVFVCRLPHDTQIAPHLSRVMLVDCGRYHHRIPTLLDIGSQTRRHFDTRCLFPFHATAHHSRCRLFHAEPLVF